MNKKLKIILGVSLLTAALAFIAASICSDETKKQVVVKQYQLSDYLGAYCTNSFVISINQNEIKGRAEAFASNSMVYFYGEDNSLKWSFDGEAYFSSFTNLPFRGITTIYFATNNKVMGCHITNGIVFVYGKIYLILNPANGQADPLGAD